MLPARGQVVVRIVGVDDLVAFQRGNDAFLGKGRERRRAVVVDEGHDAVSFKTMLSSTRHRTSGGRPEASAVSLSRLRVFAFTASGAPSRGCARLALGAQATRENPSLGSGSHFPIMDTELC